MAETMIASPSKIDHSIRKNKKPLMEKRRRARINSCLSQLKSLVLQAIKKDSSQFSKLEKADILELTVKHLRALQRQQAAGVMTQDPNVVGKYRAGFNECAKEVVRYMGSVREVTEDVKERVVGHLAGCLQVVNQVTPMESLQQQHHHHHQHPQVNALKPLHMHVPAPAAQPQQPITGGVTTPSVIMHTAAAASSSSLHPFPSSSTSRLPSSPSSSSSSPSSLPPLQLSSDPQVATGAFKIVPNSAGGAVAVYLGAGISQQPRCGNAVSIDAIPVYSVSVPPPSTSQARPPHSSSAFASSSSRIGDVLPVPLALSLPHNSSAAMSERDEYHHTLPVPTSGLPVDLRPPHKVKAFGGEFSSPASSPSSSPSCFSTLSVSSPSSSRFSPELKTEYSPMSMSHCASPSSSLGDDKLVWRPW